MINFELSKRLFEIASQVKQNDKIADIGTDHAYVPIFLIDKGIVDTAIAADVSRGSCEKALDNIKRHKMQEKIKVVHSNGLQKLLNEDFNTVVIAGMGGPLMKRILSHCMEKVITLDRLILQPQSEIDVVRKYVHRIGFKIEKEIMLKENDQIYTIIVCEKGKENYTNIEYKYGKINLDTKSSVLKEHIQNQIKSYNQILKSIQNNSTESSIKRVEELNDFIVELKEVLDVYFT